ncbi:hypothetical protein NL676_028410 [Syzygium grande]|nr:hypothetical protein NL676_028410 [Syzygium grande]
MLEDNQEEEFKLWNELFFISLVKKTTKLARAAFPPSPQAELKALGVPDDVSLEISKEEISSRKKIVLLLLTTGVRKKEPLEEEGEGARFIGEQCRSWDLGVGMRFLLNEKVEDKLSR